MQGEGFGQGAMQAVGCRVWVQGSGLQGLRDRRLEHSRWLEYSRRLEVRCWSRLHDLLPLSPGEAALM